MSEFEGFGDMTPEERIDAIAQEPLLSTGKLPSPEAVEEAKRIAKLGEGARPGVDSVSSPDSVPERNQQGRDSDNVPVPALPEKPLTEEEEQAIRDHYGYAPTEKRTQALRRLADRMIASSTRGNWVGPLPEDIEKVWGGGRVDATGFPAERTARKLLAAWGLDKFRSSAIHLAAIRDQEREGKMAVVREAYRDAMGKKR